THGHMDHVSGVTPLQREYSVPLYLNPADQPFLDSDMNRAFAVESGTVPPTAVDHPLTEGAELTLADLDIRVLATPGHTPGSVSLLIGGRLYSGDTLFSGSVGRTDLPGGDFHRLQDSLARLCRLPGDTPVFPGHGEETTIAIETESNPYLP
ncbi:MAG TPA: MBL fold metallo-hydrolase, partial [Candidatus Aminicenantes bacterium]|nr:MBL fold metallo-hydrolase [Candidatus Aminicenantes bacterium]